MFHCGASLPSQVVVAVVVGEVLAFDLAEESCAHHDDSSQSFEVPSVMNQLLLLAILPVKSY